MEGVYAAYQQMKDKAKAYMPKLDEQMLDRAFELAVSAHGEQMRASGEKFVSHPVAVADILCEFEMDTDTLVAALLHDVVEDTSYSIDEIKSLFSEDIAMLVAGVTKLSKIPYSTKEEQQVENLRKMFLAMAKDIRVIIIKLADRLHNMRTLKFVPEEKQREKARETMEVYAPLAHRLGMSKIKWELEDLSLRYLDPIAYHEIAENVAQKRAERLESIEQIKADLKSGLDKLGIKSHIEGRAKHFYSIYRKMYAQNISVDQIYDLIAVRVIVDSISECYAVLGMVHELYKPIPGRFKDYIAMPKKNMYQSLHTSLIAPSGRPFEVQIRTWDMHRIAEVGIAAHWKYKEGKTGTASDIDGKLEWLRQLLEIQKDLTDAEDFMRTLKIDLFEDEVFVFSPKGDVINLPSGASTVDFAYSIHSAIGNKMVGAKVNGKIVPIEYELQNGDIVEIITSSTTRGPSRDWLKIIKTNQARKRINDWFKKENREENIIHGKAALEKEMKRIGIPLSILNEKLVMEPILSRYTMPTLDDLYAVIGFGGLQTMKIIARLKEAYKKEIKPDIIEELKQNTEYKGSGNTEGIIVRGVDNCLVKFARCCNPVPGDEIVGYITKGRGVSVHRKDCINVLHLENSSEELRRFIEVAWTDTGTSSYITDLQIIAIDRAGLVVEATMLISELKITMHAINARGTKDGLAIINITVEIGNKEQLDKLIKRFWKIEGVTSVIRTKQ